MTAEEESTELSNSDKLAQALEQLSTDQIRFVIARCNSSTDKDAAKSIKVKPSTVYQWRQRGAPIDEALELMLLDGVVAAITLRRRALAKAMAVKVAGLDSKTEHTRQNVATEIIEWELGKATQRKELSGPDGDAIAVKTYVTISPDDWDEEEPDDEQR